jgi:thiol-disulfide isomerase/thioredoxin
MKKQINIIIAFAILLAIIACGNKTTNKNPNVKGTLTNAEKGTAVYLEKLTPGKIEQLDTTYTDENGEFSFNYSVKDKGFYRLKVNEQNYLNLILDSNERVTITGNIDSLTDFYTVTGSEESKRLQDYNNFIKKNYMLRDSLNRLYQANINNPGKDTILPQLEIKFQEAVRDLTNYVINEVNQDPSSFLSLALVEQLNPDEHLEVYKKVDQAVGEKYPNSPYYLAFHQKVQSISQLATGTEIPNIQLPDPNGNIRSLYDLKGKYVLVDFWASWCKPCRDENPNVVRLYKKYHNKGFDVYSVSLDGLPNQPNAKQGWLEAIKQDGLEWPNHVSELKGWQSLVVQEFGIQGIPFAILIDPEGKIIAKNIRGAALEEKLAAIFENK